MTGQFLGPHLYDRSLSCQFESGPHLYRSAIFLSCQFSFWDRTYTIGHHLISLSRGRTYTIGHYRVNLSRGRTYIDQPSSYQFEFEFLSWDRTYIDRSLFCRFELSLVHLRVTPA